ncbi:unnamed protein product [Rotaria sp. Silwood1]|nr:unnamed protein product [Rotaria sp. Silwood1]CAF3417985.1 unnamed protein product [Rotaria sp. Silwood1]
MIILSLRKVEPKNWECFLKDEKKTPMKPIPKLDQTKESSESFLNMVEEMYENGDDDTKRAIAKAWVKSQEKMNTLTAESHDKKNTGIIKTPDFTIYPA